MATFREGERIGFDCLQVVRLALVANTPQSGTMQALVRSRNSNQRVRERQISSPMPSSVPRRRNGRTADVQVKGWTIEMSRKRVTFWKYHHRSERHDPNHHRCNGIDLLHQRNRCRSPRTIDTASVCPGAVAQHDPPHPIRLPSGYTSSACDSSHATRRRRLVAQHDPSDPCGRSGRD